ncbi:envelope stress response membrane protein PspC [Sphingomonas sp. G-3-2-10]|jgi:phage shock protein C|uniref:envelope stress response membrane protein PspC n=1 Tax=Sphingomonas sp. G-3-2-10 TaxID=2728838 RepID=UPI00146B602D|nr:envelope stress response membrane protein PspC [Sphingomonas sp. G-3-2-10]NML04627.1 envelope stress response membrane protein PspC [Sphingomonas sp. G-3-2-10]
MSASRTKFYLDKQNGKVFGVCSGLADYTGIEALWLRVGMILLTLMTSGMVIVAYILIAMMAPAKPRELYTGAEDQKFWQGVRSNPKRSTAEVRSKFRDIDRRLADIEMYYTSRNTRLADEIDSLR